MDDKKDGHREYAAERKTNIIRLTEDLRRSESLLAEFVGSPGPVATKYGLKLTQEETTALAAIAASEELNEAALAAVAGGNQVELGDWTCVNVGC